MLTIQQAKNIILQYSRSFGTEEIALRDALHRVTSSDICSDRNYPSFNRSAMDGFAVKVDDLKHNACLKVIDEIHAGDFYEDDFEAGECVRIMTGAPVPSTANAVIKSEEAIEKNKSVLFTCEKVNPGQNIALCGEDIKSAELIFSKGTQLSAKAMGTLAAIGCAKVQVEKLPKVTVFSTGNEVQTVNAQILPQHIRDSNGFALYGLLQSYHIQTQIHDPLPDDPIELKKAFLQGLKSDILIISGGVSKGVADYVPGVLKELGVKELFQHVKIKPGKPLWVGNYQNEKIVFALPGNPVAVQIAFKIFIEPYLRKCMGMKPLQSIYFPMDISRQRYSRFDEYFPVILKKSNKSMYVHPISYNGSGDIKVMAQSDGIALQPADKKILEQDRSVEFFPWQ